jgi:hypothetical protein
MTRLGCVCKPCLTAASSECVAVTVWNRGVMANCVDEAPGACVRVRVRGIGSTCLGVVALGNEGRGPFGCVRLGGGGGKG